MKRKLPRVALAGFAVALALTACSPGGGGGGGTYNPQVSVSIAQSGPGFIKIDATPTGFPGSGPYESTVLITDLVGGMTYTASTIPTFPAMTDFVSYVDGDTTYVRIKAKVTMTRGGRSATAEQEGIVPVPSGA